MVQATRPWIIPEFELFLKLLRQVYGDSGEAVNALPGPRKSKAQL